MIVGPKRLAFVGIGVFPESEEISVSGKRTWNGSCAVLLSIERTVNEIVLRIRVAPFTPEEVDRCGLFQDIKAN
jgi:hypothetical protein